MSEQLSGSVSVGYSVVAGKVALAGGQPDSGASCTPDGSMMDQERRDEVLLRLAKAAGQVQGISRMVSADRYCVDVLNQIAAAQKALDGVARIMARNYLERCVTDAINGGDPLIYDEVMRVLYRTR